MMVVSHVWKEILVLLLIAVGLGTTLSGLFGVLIPDLATYQRPTAHDSPGGMLVLTQEQTFGEAVGLGIGITLAGGALLSGTLVWALAKVWPR